MASAAAATVGGVDVGRSGVRRVREGGVEGVDNVEARACTFEHTTSALVSVFCVPAQYPCAYAAPTHHLVENALAWLITLFLAEACSQEW